MDTVLNVKLWDKEVAAVAWDKDEEYATMEFYDSFAKEGLDIAPLIMPLSDIVRGDRVYSFPIHKGKTFKGLPGLLADSLPDDYGNKILDEWFASKGIIISSTVQIQLYMIFCYNRPSTMSLGRKLLTS